ncbi:non-lysosomal glucosylceramidase [Coccinella septempunctata]|uniref:non-lysosomal glucosylceramidase n=1 Tax=Coccinella septempunctata TaxID=41139 RepID=UPI001D084DAF|nr:non-lysosomal glucosylceramidase [Coccinella septempunctata]
MESASDEIAVPKYGLKLKLNHEYPENRSQSYIPSLRTIWTLLPLIIRYIFFYLKCKLTGKSIIMDYFYPRRAERIYGVPIGGIGSGTIGRGFKGEFCRFQLKPGLYEWETVEANQFIVTIKDEHERTIFHSLLSTFPKKTLSAWESLIEGSKCKYTALYPRSWTEYDLSEYGIKLLCRQVSPIIPHNYKDSSLPCAVFEWNVQNTSDAKRIVTIAFTFKNGTGSKKEDKSSACHTKPFKVGIADGIILYHTICGMPSSYVLATEADSAHEISKCLFFDPNSSGSEPWYQLKNDGRFEKQSETNTRMIHGEMACGLAVKVTVKPTESELIKYNLVWDIPMINFPLRMKKYYKKYTDYFGREDAGLKISQYAFQNYGQWEKDIHLWQSTILNDANLPTWFKTALFNQLYYVSDGGSIWLTLEEEEKQKLPETDPRKEYGRFAYLEGHEYKMYNTYDVHFYASFALNMNWPHLQSIIQYDMKDMVFKEIPDRVTILFDGESVERKVANTIPHDVGDPGEEPFILPNSYNIHDVSDWKDLNSKFVLQVFRDAWLCQDGQINDVYLKDMYDACYTVTMNLLRFDTDKDGLIENDSKPDQTYDTWTMTGPSAYCGGLWLASLYAMAKIAERLDKQEDYKKFNSLLHKGMQSFEQKLWNGIYYNFDCSDDEKKSIMADQLCGHWYLRASGFNHEVFPKNNVESSLRTIYANNVQSFCNGNMGAVNGFIGGEEDRFTVQSLEVWPGVTYALASTMIFEGMVTEGFKTAEGMYNSMTDLFGLAFDYPEAIYAHKNYRSIGYMRPLSIWSMLLAYQKSQLKTASK